MHVSEWMLRLSVHVSEWMQRCMWEGTSLPDKWLRCMLSGLTLGPSLKTLPCGHVFPFPDANISTVLQGTWRVQHGLLQVPPWMVRH